MCDNLHDRLQTLESAAFAACVEKCTDFHEIRNIVNTVDQAMRAINRAYIVVNKMEDKLEEQIQNRQLVYHTKR